MSPCGVALDKRSLLRFSSAPSLLVYCSSTNISCADICCQVRYNTLVMSRRSRSPLSPTQEYTKNAYEWLYSLYPEYTEADGDETTQDFPSGNYTVYQSVENESLVFRNRDETVVYAERNPKACMFREWSIDIEGDDRCAEPQVKWSVKKVYKPRLCQASKGLARWGETDPDSSPGHRYILNVLSPERAAKEEAKATASKTVTFQDPAENYLDEDERLPSNINLTHAVAKGSDDEVREWIRRYRREHTPNETTAEINLPDKAGWTPLMKAAARGKPAMVADLLIAGA